MALFKTRQTIILSLLQGGVGILVVGLIFNNWCIIGFEIYTHVLEIHIGTWKFALPSILQNMECITKGCFYTKSQGHVQSKSNIPIHAKIEISPKGFYIRNQG
jgi:hypothetical protein